MAEVAFRIVCERIDDKRLKDIDLSDLQGDKIVKNGLIVAEGCELKDVRNKR